MTCIKSVFSCLYVYYTNEMYNMIRKCFSWLGSWLVRGNNYFLHVCGTMCTHLSKYTTHSMQMNINRVYSYFSLNSRC